jgi:hypothetical protein
MAVSSLSATFVPSLSQTNSSPLLSSKPKFQSLTFLSGNSKSLRLSTVVHAAPEVLNSEVTKDVESVNTDFQVLEFTFLPFSSIFIHVYILCWIMRNLEACTLDRTLRLRHLIVNIEVRVWLCGEKN